MIRFVLNDAVERYEGPPLARLLDVLRADFGLTGAKEGCGEGECGSCSVLLDGSVVNACLVPMLQVAGRELRTIEALAPDDPLVAAFVEEGAVQCGACTPGLVVAARALLDAVPQPETDTIREALAGNLCRCTGYASVLRAVERASGAAAAGVARSADRAEGGSGLPSANAPRELGEALRILGRSAVRPTVLAGCTDLMVGRPSPAAVLDLGRVDALEGVRVGEDAVRIGATTSFATIGEEVAIREHFPILAEAAATIGARQNQNRATLGGNIVNASPAGDSLPVLLALDARLVLASERGERVMPYAQMHRAYRETELGADELVLRAELPIPAPGFQRFRKVGTRRAQAIAIVNLAFTATLRDGKLADVRIAAGAVAPTPIRLFEAEATCEGEAPSAALAERVAEIARAEVSPIDDLRATASYRRFALGKLVRRFVLEAMSPS